MPLPSQLQECVASRVIVAESILQEAQTHLEFLGYTVERQDDGLFVHQEGRFNWTLRDFRGGVIFMKVFNANDAGQAGREAMLAFSNRINAESSLLRAYVDARGNLALDAWYPNLYERRSFGLFAMALETDLREQLNRCREEVDTLLR